MATAAVPANSIQNGGSAHGPTEVHHGFRGFIARHPVTSFFALAYVISWSCWGVAGLGGGQVVFLLGGLGPLIV